MTIRVGHPHCWDEVIGDDERLISRNYSGERRVRGRRGLLLIDLYNRAFGKERLPLRESMAAYPSSCGLPAWEALPVVEELLGTARTAGRPVVHTVADETNRAGVVPTLRAVYGEHDAQTADEDGWPNRIVDSLTPAPGELVVGKSRASAFFGTTLDTYFRSVGVESLVVVGESTSGCVRASVADAYSLGFDVVVVEDGVFDRSPLSHKMSLFDLHLKYATVVDKDTAASLLRSLEPAVLDVRMT